MLRILLILLALTGQALADCSTTTELTLQDAIKEAPNQVVAVLEKDALLSFIVKLRDNHYLIGVLPPIERMYIVTTKDGNNVLMMLFIDGCLIGAFPGSKEIVIGLLK